MLGHRWASQSLRWDGSGKEKQKRKSSRDDEKRRAQPVGSIAERASRLIRMHTSSPLVGWDGMGGVDGMDGVDVVDVMVGFLFFEG